MQSFVINNSLERLGAEVFTGIDDADANWVIVVVDDDMYVLCDLRCMQLGSSHFKNISRVPFTHFPNLSPQKMKRNLSANI